ncbi:MAG: tRNA 2-thiouridine(34) synthase MnmA [Oscillospiraceae bacterium]|nr:tRNA 2-thiouridine(34) synthase MnmA [Oscillospiraceae bacterium]
MAKNGALIAMSGGVDSTVAAWIMAQNGYDCDGATMRLHTSGGDGENDARRAAEILGIPFHVFDFSDCFAKEVIEKFISAYREGRTPNPCVDCNRSIKFGVFLDKAREIGKDYLVTGHYVQVEYDKGAGRYILKKAAYSAKDQSYVLYSLTQDQLAHIIFPLGGFASKDETRAIAREAGLKNAEKGESQDICFVPDGDYVSFITKYTGSPPEKGRFVDTHGRDLGENNGIVSYTVGQRRGLGLAMPEPSYVLEIRPEDNTVIVGGDELLYSKTLIAKDINFIPISRLDAPLKAHVKIRYKQPEQAATVFQLDDNTMRIEFESPQRAITKGQAAVIYDGDIVIGGGTIV